MAELARMIAAPRTLEQILNDVTTTAVELIPGADVSGILLVKKGGEFESLADTAGLAAELDKLQHDFGEGPCAEAALQETVVRSDDLRRAYRRAVNLQRHAGCFLCLFVANNSELRL